MVQIGNHLKINVAHGLRQRTRDFYAGLLGCKPLASPSDDLDLYEFDGGFVLGLFFVDPAQTLSEAQYLNALWMELKVDDPAAWKSRLLDFGVTPVAFPDPNRFFFAAPGGQVFRLAPLDGGI
jgi:catechol 2,3-dioxygenase-like lactoylglutathione lyase family enzyme